MPLTVQNRARLVNLITDLRPTWDAAGTESAVKTLDTRYANDPLRVVAEAVERAREARALTPAAMHDVEIQQRIRGTDQPAVTSRPTVSRVTAGCEFHNGTTTDDLGRFVCCLQEGRDTTPGYLRVGSSPPPAEVAARIREQFEQRRSGVVPQTKQENAK